MSDVADLSSSEGDGGAGGRRPSGGSSGDAGSWSSVGGSGGGSGMSGVGGGGGAAGSSRAAAGSSGAGAGGAGAGSGGGGSGGANAGAGGQSASGAGGTTSCEPASVCAPSVPEGWSPVTTTATTGEMALSCAGGTRLGLSVSGPVTCSPCSCQETAKGSCTPTSVRVFAEPTCTDAGQERALASAPAPASGSVDCQTIPYSNQTLLYGYVQYAATPSTFAASGGTPVARPAPFETALDACPLPASNTCPGGACLPPGAVMCVTKTGDTPCPSSFPTRTLAYATAFDGRTCTTCGCSAIADCEGVRLGIRANTNCGLASFGGETEKSFKSSTCTVLSSAKQDKTWTVDRGESIPRSSSATPSGGAPTGQVTPTEPVTVCCP